jgi:hypothetical protein
VCPTITTALRIFVSWPASVASGERTFNVLKQVKNYYRSTMGQDRLNGFKRWFQMVSNATLSINCDLAVGSLFNDALSVTILYSVDDRMISK